MLLDRVRSADTPASGRDKSETQTSQITESLFSCFDGLAEPRGPPPHERAWRTGSRPGHVRSLLRQGRLTWYRLEGNMTIPPQEMGPITFQPPEVAASWTLYLTIPVQRWARSESNHPDGDATWG